MNKLITFKGWEIYEINYNSQGIPKGIILVLDTFIMKTNRKLIGITVINQSHNTV